ncbi:MAG: DUF2059 domain-containing protein [Roseobacter sp.]
MAKVEHFTLIGLIVRTKIFACALVVISFASPSQADPRAAADYIVSQTVTHEMFEAVISVQRPLIIGTLQNELRAKGINLPDPDRFFDVFMEEFVDEFVKSMQEQSASIYLDNFTDQQLLDIAEFFKTESGQAYLSMTPTLMQEGAQLGQKAGEEAGANVAGRVAARIKKEGLVVVDDPSILSRLLEVLK